MPSVVYRREVNAATLRGLLDLERRAKDPKLLRSESLEPVK